MRLFGRHVPHPRTFGKAWETWLSGQDKMAGRVAMKARPLRIHFEINDYCNLKCVMCSRENEGIPKDTGAIPLEWVKDLEPYLRRASYVGIAGNGEPFMHRDMMDILEYLCSLRCVPSTITNCTLLREPLRKRLAKLGPSLLMASIDGGTKKVFESIRLNADFDVIEENLFQLKKEKERVGSVYPVVNFINVLMKQNIDDLENVVRLAHRVGVAEINVQNLFPYHDGAWDHILTDFDLIDERIAEARKLAAECRIKINYNPMGFSIERRLDHARSKGSVTAPTSGLQLNGRELERKTVGKVFAVGAAGAILANEPLQGSVALLEDPDDRDSDPNLANVETFGSEEKLSPETHRVVTPPTAAPNLKEGEPKYYCQNVFQQLHVVVSGEVRPCCFWTGPILGHIREKTVDELWNSSTMQGVRSSILQGNLPKDCKTCHILVPYDQNAIKADTWRETKEALKR